MNQWKAKLLEEKVWNIVPSN